MSPDYPWELSAVKATDKIRGVHYGVVLSQEYQAGAYEGESFKVGCRYKLGYSWVQVWNIAEWAKVY